MFGVKRSREEYSQTSNKKECLLLTTPPTPVPIVRQNAKLDFNEDVSKLSNENK